MEDVVYELTVCMGTVSRWRCLIQTNDLCRVQANKRFLRFNVCRIALI